MRGLLLLAGLAMAATSPSASAQQKIKNPPKLPLPPIIRTLPPIKPVVTEPKKPEPKPAPEPPAPTPAAALEIPFRTTTAPIEVVGNKALPAPLAEFTPVRRTTSAIEVTGSPTLPAPLAAFSPIRLTTPPIAVVGTEE